jgi:mono/diheme cytochrome c family protein
MKKSLAVLAGLALASSMAMAGDLAANADYKAKCAMCHGANGEGKPAMKVAPMKEAASKSDAELTETITKGKPPKMPAFGGKLTADQIKALVADIKSLK